MNKDELLNQVNPMVFTDGKEIYGKFIEEYGVHSKGLFIVAPSGAGKTYFVKHQETKEWIDGDELWMATNAHPDTDWWNQGLDVIFQTDQKSDVITMQARKLGLWVLGASNYWLIPDAIVIPDWETHKRYIIERENNHYDGGAKSDNFDQVLGHIQSLKDFAAEHNVPIYMSIEEAVESLTKDIS